MEECAELIGELSILQKVLAKHLQYEDSKVADIESEIGDVLAGIENLLKFNKDLNRERIETRKLEKVSSWK